MLETDAKTKLCPFKMASSLPGAPMHCSGSECMAWEQWTDPVWDDGGSEGIVRKITRHKPKDPPQGHCGMVPPELNCRYE